MAGPRSKPAVVYVLVRIAFRAHEEQWVRTIVGVFSTIKRAQQEVTRYVQQHVGERIQKLPPWQPTRGSDALLFAYGRDHHDFRFELSPWAVDAEQH